MTILPAERDLPPAARGAARTRVVAAVAQPPATPRRWMPVAAAAAVVALVGAAVAVADRTTGTAPVPPAATSARPPAPTPIPPATIPTLAQVIDRCGIDLMYTDARYVARYQGDNAVTWLFLSTRKQSSTVCTWEAGQTGILASFANDWFPEDGGMGAAPDNRLHITQDVMKPGVEVGATLSPDYRQFDPDRRVLVGPVPATVVKVVVEGPDGTQVAGLGSHWFVYHLRKPGTYRVDGYDADGDVVAGDNVMTRR